MKVAVQGTRTNERQCRKSWPTFSPNSVKRQLLRFALPWRATANYWLPSSASMVSIWRAHPDIRPHHSLENSTRLCNSCMLSLIHQPSLNPTATDQLRRRMAIFCYLMMSSSSPMTLPFWSRIVGTPRMFHPLHFKRRRMGLWSLSPATRRQ